MDWFQSVVLDYLRFDRRLFVNPECLIHLDPDAPLRQGRHWYCDTIAAHFGDRTLYLCEITYARLPQALLRRLAAWRAAWPEVRAAVLRDSKAPPDWEVRPWVFLPESNVPLVARKFPEAGTAGGAAGPFPAPRLTALELVLPWTDRRPERSVSW